MTMIPSGEGILTAETMIGKDDRWSVVLVSSLHNLKDSFADNKYLHIGQEKLMLLRVMRKSKFSIGEVL